MHNQMDEDDDLPPPLEDYNKRSMQLREDEFAKRLRMERERIAAKRKASRSGDDSVRKQTREDDGFDHLYDGMGALHISSDQWINRVRFRGESSERSGEWKTTRVMDVERGMTPDQKRQIIRDKIKASQQLTAREIDFVLDRDSEFTADELREMKKLVSDNARMINNMRRVRAVARDGQSVSLV